MSYILDALKKIEHEKNVKSNASGRINISGDLLYERKQPQGRNGIWRVAAIVAIASLVTCAGTWLALKETGKRRAEIIHSSVSPAPQRITPPVSQAVPPAVSLPVRTQPLPPVAVQPEPQRAAITENRKVPLPETHRANKQYLAPLAPLQQSLRLVPAPAGIKLSGIAWQDDRSARRAVVNGFLLKEGAVVSGATITDIQATRVRFTSSAGQFELTLDAMLPTENTR